MTILFVSGDLSPFFRIKILFDTHKRAQNKKFRRLNCIYAIEAD